MGEFGDKFRNAREKKELSYDQVSNVTKISARMLQAIEDEHFDVLPGGVFNKGFIRAYAKHLGMDPEETVTDYLACLRQAQIDAHEVWEPERPPQPRPVAPEPRPRVVVVPSQPVLKPVEKASAPVQVEELPELQLPRVEDVRPPRKNFSERSPIEIPWRIVAVALIVIVLVAILWTRHSHRTASASLAVSKSQTAAVVTPPAPSAAVVPATVAPAAVPSDSTAKPIPPAPAKALVANSAPAKPTPAPKATNASASEPSKLVADSSTKGSPNDAPTRTPATSGAKPSAKPVQLSLLIRAQETSWIAVQADGETVSEETLIAPAHASIRASHEIVARIGNAAGVTFVLNGHEIPAGGAEAEVKTFVFDANGARVVPTSQAPLPAR